MFSFSMLLNSAQCNQKVPLDTIAKVANDIRKRVDAAGDITIFNVQRSHEFY